MAALFMDAVPEPPGWSVDWAMLEDAFDWFRRLQSCPQDPVFHAEGNVLVHTKLVCEALCDSTEWRALDRPTRALVFWSALLHDVAKPDCTKEEANDRYTAPGHSRRGQIMARRILWEMDLDYRQRESLCHMITHHQVPFFLVDKEDAPRRVHLISHQTRCDLLAMLAEADIRGRICADREQLLDNIELFAELCREERCYSGPREFASDHSRFCYFRNAERSPDYEAFDDHRCEVTLLSGLPAAGKDRWLRKNAYEAEVISLDDLRTEMKISVSGNQGPVIAEARERARVALRKAEAFVWNATNLSRDFRKPLIDLFAGYRARVKIVYVETTASEQSRRNSERSAAVPAKAIERMLKRWQPPDLTECHQLDVELSS